MTGVQTCALPISNDNSGAILIYGDVEYDNDKVHNGRFDRMLYLKNTIHQQGALYNRNCFESTELGNGKGFRFNPNYKVLADYDLNLRLFKGDLPARNTKQIISRCGSKGISKKVSLRLYLEELKIKNSLLGWYTAPFLLILVLAKYTIKRTSVIWKWMSK